MNLTQLEYRRYRIGHGLFALIFLTVSGMLWQSHAAGQLLRQRMANDTTFAITTRKEAQVAAQLCNRVRPGDEVWIVNTRCADPGPCRLEDLETATQVYQRIDDQFCPSGSRQLIQRINEDSVRENIVFIHGNRTDYRWARLRGTQAYETIMNIGPDCGQYECDYPLPPVRWIIWSWPTDTLRGPRRDLEVKRARAYGEGQLLASFLKEIRQPEIGVVAYSLGAQALVSALCCWQQVTEATDSPVVGAPGEITTVLRDADPPTVAQPISNAPSWDNSGEWSTETVIDVQLSQQVMEQIERATVLSEGEPGVNAGTEARSDCHTTHRCFGPRLRIVMVAAAVPADWFRSRLGHACIRDCAASLTLINNPQDRVLNIYRKITRMGPLGSELGLAINPVPTITHLVRQNSLNNHVLTEYFSGESTRRQIRESLFLFSTDTEQDVTEDR